MVRVGLIGFGMAGQAFHARVIRGVPGMELACILERRGTRAHEKYPGVRVARTLEELLADKEIQLCVIATPNDSHFELAKACLSADRDVVVDKPFTPTLKESEELVRLKTHSAQLTAILEGSGEVGKRLDFLLQEMNREANTVLSKTGGLGDLGLTITELALAAKAEIDKIREQALNVE